MIDEVFKIELLTPDEIRRGIEHYDSLDVAWEIPPGAQGAITGALAKVIKALGFEGEEVDHSRHLILGYLCGPLDKPLKPMSSKRLSDGQWIGLSRWESERLENGSYSQRRTFPDELTQVLYRARVDVESGRGVIPLIGLLKAWEMEQYRDYYDLDSFVDYIRLKKEQS